MMIKNNQFTIRTGFIIFAQLLAVFILAADLAPSAIASKAGNRKSKLTANLNAQQDPIKVWFNHYDQIRRQAQLSPAERQRLIKSWVKVYPFLCPDRTKPWHNNY